MVDFKKMRWVSRMRKVKRDYEGDREVAHSKADDVLCDLLIELGYEDVVKEFKSIEKWYA